MECRFCGKPTTLLLDGMPICEDCYEKAGSCCLEFGGADLWQTRQDEARNGQPDGPGNDEREKRADPRKPV